MDHLANKRVKLEEDKKERTLWADLHIDLLLLIMLRLSFPDYLAFSGVCKAWRSIAIEHKREFISHQPPFIVILSSKAKKSCSFLNTFNQDRYKTKLSELISKCCYGFCGGFLIFQSKRDNNFLAVNPITRQEFRFSGLRDTKYCARRPPLFRVAVTYSTSLADFVGVLLVGRSFLTVSRSIGDIRIHSSMPREILDLTVFKGVLYVLTRDAKIGKLEYSAERTLTLTIMKVRDAPFLSDGSVHLIASNEDLFILDSLHQRSFRIYRLNWQQNCWVRVESLGNYSMFLGNRNCCAVRSMTKWGGRSNCIYRLEDDFSIEGPARCSVWSLDGQLLEKFPIHRPLSRVHIEPFVWYFPMMN